MQIIMPGEIEPVQTQIMDEDEATRLSAHLFERLDENFYYRVQLQVDNGDTPSHIIGLTGDYAKVLNETAEKYMAMLEENEVEFDFIRHWLILGLKNGNIAWHTDSPGDIRFMLNIGKAATHLELATKWKPHFYCPGDPDERNKPEAFEAMPIEFGAAYASNALVTNEAVLRPHQTPVDVGRLMLRTSVYGAEDWWEFAIGNGVPISLQDLT